ncbi:MAG: 2-oxo acid dehydrogenase subunit E2 [Tannerella sp.]|jgi:pyruvate dehydrogenase E2 component (dihydrolipoamide acetyltransferase)|nr:2-oxo acid dehydrogenase subunit E2 [Tannerella sp.]
MATVIIMPKQGQSVESCILTELKKKKGDTVAVGEVLFSYETDKASFEEEAKVAGTVLDVFFAEGDEIPVLTNVMVIGEVGEDYSALVGGATGSAVASAVAKTPAGSTDSTVSGDNEASEKPSIPDVPNPSIPQSFNPSTSSKQSPVSPRAKSLAEKHAIVAETLEGSGPGGRVIERDVKAAIEAAPKVTPLAKAIINATGAQKPETGTGPAGAVRGADVTAAMQNPVYTADSEVKPLTNMRKIIAKAMHASLQNSAQLTHHLGADARRIMALRKRIKQALKDGYPTDITLNDMVCYAVIRALKQFPQVNAHFLGDSIRYFHKVHLGLAVDTERGLMVPTVRNADDLSIAGLANQLKEVANACKKGGIAPDLLSPEAASFTVSNLGNYGVEIFTPVINLPQAAILGVNTIVPRPKDLGDGIYGFVPYMGLSLTYDHRALDGGEATRFLKQIAVEIENLEIEIG